MHASSFFAVLVLLSHLSTPARAAPWLSKPTAEKIDRQIHRQLVDRMRQSAPARALSQPLFDLRGGKCEAPVTGRRVSTVIDDMARDDGFRLRTSWDDGRKTGTQKLDFRNRRSGDFSRHSAVLCNGRPGTAVVREFKANGGEGEGWMAELSTRHVITLPKDLTRQQAADLHTGFADELIAAARDGFPVMLTRKVERAGQSAAQRRAARALPWSTARPPAGQPATCTMFIHSRNRWTRAPLGPGSFLRTVQRLGDLAAARP